ncbi:transcription initiation factor IIB [Haloarcula sediminis]|uniref:transcription initiation factor IIB n=1 Tax=Haloarcula sediminis TaxID=3111777 RepID=UPI002D776BDF|nr:transcription initiation factor IIB family protein [Haloarcula sp. CK38]
MSTDSSSVATEHTEQPEKNDVETHERHTSTTDQCSECSELKLRWDGTERYCPECGLVVEGDCIDYGPEWTPYDTEERHRVGGPVTNARHDWGISAEIGRHRDARGQQLPAAKRRKLNRLRRWDRQAQFEGKAEQNLAHGLSEIRRIVGALDLSESICTQACALYRTAANEDLIRGRSIEAMAAAGVYAACRCSGLPRTIEEVGEVSTVSRERVSNAYSVMNHELNLPAVPMAPVQYVPRFASDLDLSREVRQRALKLAREASEVGLGNGCRPTGVAAACVYEAAREGGAKVTQTSLADLANVSAMTLREQWKKLQSMLEHPADSGTEVHG